MKLNTAKVDFTGNSTENMEKTGDLFDLSEIE
jgi:hypothetical protein